MQSKSKAAETTKKRHGEGFYSRIAKLAWKNRKPQPLTGFAKLKAEGRMDELRAISAEGGRNKKGYKKNANKKATPAQDAHETVRVQEKDDYLDEEAFVIFEDDFPTAPTEAQEVGTGVSE